MVAGVLYGSGLRISEGLHLRLKDIDFNRAEITVRRGKGGKDRITMLSGSVAPALREQVERVREVHEKDRRNGAGWVELPYALARKYPNAGRELGWQWLFPASRCRRLSYDDRIGRHHRDPSGVQRAFKEAAKESGILKRVTSHTFRHSFATHLLENGYDIRTIQELLGHASVRATMIYTHVLNRGPLGVQSPLDLPIEEAPDNGFHSDLDSPAD